MVEILSLPELSLEDITTAYRFLKFSKSSNLLVQEISPDCSNLFGFITSHYPDPTSSQEPLQSDSSTNRRGRSAGPEASPEYPSWIVEGKSKLRVDQAQFLCLTRSLSSYFVYADWLASQRPHSLEIVHPFSLLSEPSTTGNMGNTPEDFD